MARKTGSHSQITGPRIKQVALHLFAKHGFAAVSMRQIASEVGVQAGAIYNYTPDKQALLFDLLRGHMEDLLAQWRAQDVPNDAAAALEHFVRFHIEFHLARPELVFISYMELRNLTPNNFAQISQLRGDYENVVRDMLASGEKSGDFAVPDAKIASFALIAMLTGVVDWFRADGQLSVDQLQDQYCQMACNMVGISARAE